MRLQLLEKIILCQKEEFIMLRTLFVSSTFRDMHFERDVIHSKVVPAINAISKQYGESVSVCDLRWGIDTSEMTENESAAKVLSVCLNEIDRSRPYMIVILGYRYGWMPGKERIGATIREKEYIQLEDEDISVTALEIEYGSLLDLNMIDHTLFYFREIDGDVDAIYQAEDNLHKKKLDALKKRIQSIPGTHVRSYHVKSGEGIEKSMECFSAMVIEDLQELLIDEWKKIDALDANALDQKKQWDFLNEKNNQFMSRTSISEKCMTALCDEHMDILLYGPSGSGKSTFISHIGLLLHERSYHIVPIFCGYTPLCSSGFDILRYIVWKLENALHLSNHFSDAATKDPYKLEDWNSYFASLCHQYDSTANQELVFLIDGVDQMLQDETAQSFTFLTSEACTHIRFIVSMITAEKIPSLPYRIELKPLLPEERREIINGILSDKHREINNEVIELMLHRDAASSPLYLSLLVQRLLMMNYEDFQRIVSMGDGINAITAYQIGLLNECPDNLEDLSMHLLRQASVIIGGETALKAAEMIALSRRGLRFSDLHGLMKQKNLDWNELDTAAFIQYMGFMFIYRSDGRYDFSHNSIRIGLLRQCRDANHKHSAIADWLYQLPIDDEVRKQEVLWHLIQSDQKENFVDAAAGMILTNRKSSEMLNDMIDCILEDEGEWMIEMIKECFSMPSFSILFGFLNQELFFGIPNTPKNLTIKMHISETLHLAAQKRCVIQENDGAIWDISTASDRLADVHRWFETPEHLEFALKCVQHSLTIREQLMKSIAQYNTPEKIRKYILDQESASGLKISREPTLEESIAVIHSIRFQYERGICVTHKDISEILIDLKRYDEALKHMQETIRLREQILSRNENKISMDGENELLELAEDYRTVASLLQKMGEAEYLHEAMELCMHSLQLCEQVAKTETSTEVTNALCDSKISLAMCYYQQKEMNHALALFLECLPMLEHLDAQVRTVRSQQNLERVYNNISILYQQLGGEENQQKADRFLQKSKSLSQNIVNRMPSIETVRSKLHVTLDEVDSKLLRGTAGINAETVHAMKASFADAMNLLEGMQSKKAYKDVESVLLTAAEVLRKNNDLDSLSRERGIAELTVLRYQLALRYYPVTHDLIREMIVHFGELSETLSELAEPEQYDALFIDFLHAFGIRLEKNNKSLSHEAASFALQLSEQLVKRTHELKDYDFLAVSLAKYCTSCLTHCPEKFPHFNEQLLSVSEQLYGKTKNPKYAQMQFMAQIGRQYYQKSEPEKTEKKADDIVDDTIHTMFLIEAIKQKEQELSQLTGIANMLKRGKIKRELNTLREELEQLLRKK